MKQLSLFAPPIIESIPTPLSPPPQERPNLQEKYLRMLSELDEYQKDIVQAPLSENMSCIAGPGSGKTRTIICRAIKMVVEDKVCPTKIVLITFTNKAARELSERYVAFFQDQYPPGVAFPVPHISTIHSFCLTQIRRTMGFPRTILSEYQSAKLFREIASTIIRKEEKEAPEVSRLNQLLKIYQDMQASLDILYVAVPLFTERGMFSETVSWADAGIKHPNKGLLQLLPFSMLTNLLQGRKIQINIPFVMRGYLYSTHLNFEMWQEIVRTYWAEKYTSNSLDFGDMDFHYILAMAQFPELRNRVHSRIEHLFQDESQDATCSQFVTCLLSDKDTFEEFSKLKEGLCL